MKRKQSPNNSAPNQCIKRGFGILINLEITKPCNCKAHQKAIPKGDKEKPAVGAIDGDVGEVAKNT